MSFSENSEDSNWNISVSMTKKNSGRDSNKSANKTWRHRNFREKWLSIFTPWLGRSEDDPNTPFCKACQCVLGNNGYHLQRHGKTTKHARNLEILLNEGEEAVRQRVNRNIKRPKKLEATEMITLGMEDTSNFEAEIPFKQKHTPLMKIKTKLEKDDCEYPYMDTKMESNHMSDNYYSQPSLQPQQSYQSTQPPKRHRQHQFFQPKKDSFDMFFEAMSASAKCLPPKLGAEAKSRVSQVIAELELRAICEKEAQEKAQQQSVIAMTTQMANVVTIEPVITTVTNEENTNADN